MTAEYVVDEYVKSAQVESWKFELLPRAPYEVSYTPGHSIIGYSFDIQLGVHAFASDKSRKFQAIPNGLAWVPAGCDVYSQSSGGEYLKISCLKVSNKLRKYEQRFSNAINPKAIESAFALRRALCSKDGIDQLACENWLMAMDSSVLSVFQESTNPGQCKGWLNRQRTRQIDEFIEARLEMPLTVSELAREFGVSAGFLSREFKTAVGRSPHQYIVDKRLARVKTQLYLSDQNLCAIALDCGFSSHSHMTWHFRKQFGVTPAQLRRN